MKKGTGKIIIGVPLGILYLTALFNDSKNLLLMAIIGGLFFSLAVWGWLQRKNPEVQKKFEERKQRRKAEDERLLSEMQSKKELRRKEKALLQEEKRLQEEYKLKEKRLLAEYEQKLVNFKIEGPQLQRIIKESIAIIETTKNIDTAVSRFDLIKLDAQRLFEIAPPHSADISLYIFGKQIATIKDLSLIDALKTQWIYSYFKDKIDSELSKADILTDEKLKNTQLKKALKISLKSLDYLPENDDMLRIIHSIEDRLSKTIDIKKQSKAKNPELT